MATKRKPPKKAEPPDVSARLTEALAEKQKAEGQTHQDTPVVGDIVTVGTGKSELKITKVYDNGQAVDLELPGTNCCLTNYLAHFCANYLAHKAGLRPLI